MKQIFFTLAMAFTVCLNAQTTLDQYPQLPSANDLANGNVNSYINQLYSELGEAEEQAYNETENQYNEMIKNRDADDVSKATTFGLLSQHGEWQSAIAKGHAPRTQSDLSYKGTDYVQDFFPKLDMAAMMKMSSKQQEEYANKMIAEQFGISVDDAKKLQKMNNKQAEEFIRKLQEGGSLEMQQYNKAKEVFDNQCKAEREKAKEQMRKVYDQKYRAELKNAENEMANCDNKITQDCFRQAYARWNKAQEDYKLECYAIWRSQIVKEQEAYKQMYKKNDPKNESIVFSNYIRITLHAFDLPEMEWMFNEL